jgi:hypothetical protein
MPSNITASSLAAANGVGVKNVQFSPSANTLARKILLIRTYDEMIKTSIVPDAPLLMISKEDVGDRLGFGFMIPL